MMFQMSPRMMEEFPSATSAASILTSFTWGDTFVLWTVQPVNRQQVGVSLSDSLWYSRFSPPGKRGPWRCCWVWKYDGRTFWTREAENDSDWKGVSIKIINYICYHQHCQRSHYCDYCYTVTCVIFCGTKTKVSGSDQLAARELLQQGHEDVSVLYVLEKVMNLNRWVTLKMEGEKERGQVRGEK